MDAEDTYNGSLMFGGHVKGTGSAMDIIGAEDEDFENDIDPAVDDQSSYFQSIELVKEHPAYIMVFLQHVVLQFDCSPLLCYLHAELMKNLSSKESKKQFVDFYHTFLDKGAILRVPVPSTISFELDRTRPELFPEETQKKYIQSIQSHQFQEVNRQLEDFRAKRILGMTPGEPELMELESYRTNDKSILESKEKQLAEQLLTRLDEMHPTISTDEEKSSAIFSAIVTYMKHLGVKTKVADNKKSKGIFFRKKISGNKKGDEILKPKKGFSILDPTRWNRTGQEVHYFDNKPSKVDPEGEKSGVAERKSSTVKPPDRGELSAVHRKIATSSEGSETVAVAVAVHPPSEAADEEAGSEGTPTLEATDAGRGAVSVEQAVSGEHLVEDGGENERLPGRLGRSESLRVHERKRSQRGSAKGKQPRSRSDVDLDAAARATDLGEKPLQPQQQKKQSLTPEPGGGGGGDSPQSFLPPQSEELEPRVSELELDPPNWRNLAGPETLLRLKKSEVRRQEVINELFITEHAHVRMLKVLLEVFYQPMLNVWIPPTELHNIFPSLEDLIEVHALFLESLKNLRQENGCVMEIGDALLARFDGQEGDWFQKISSRFCSHQSFALEQLKGKQKKDPRFNQFIQEAESRPQCRRLQLKDIIPIEMQRLTKYPLLLQNIAKCTEEVDEKHKVLKAAECCRKILNHVNQQVKETENLLRLKDYQRRLDLSNLRQINHPLVNEFKNLDITAKNMVHEGQLIWRVSRDKSVDVHVLLLDDILVLLQRQDDKMVLKCHSRTMTPTPDGKQMWSPIIRLNSVMTREVATDNKAFYVIFSWQGGAQIYELVAQSSSERKIWCTLISETAGSLISETAGLIKLPLAYSRKYPRSSSSGSTQRSPGSFQENLPSSSENGGSVKEALHIDEKEKDTSLEAGHFEERSSQGDEKMGKEDRSQDLADFLLANGINTYRPSDFAGMQVAKAALDEVSVLKRLLVRNIRFSVDEEEELILRCWQESPEHRQCTEPPCTELDAWMGTEGTEKVENGPDGEGGPEENWKDAASEEQENFREENGASLPMQPEESTEVLSTPIVLSQEQSEEVGRKIRLLERNIKKLKVIEEQYCHLQKVITSFTSQQSFT
ncbi:rho guanine nucleotide exchange factor 1 isoform X2 [Microcaecilia unicolor]|uniref:Rho guanine nucleotide exchange factor 1 isoform X2 n=1 Tax=Microcaecilia unicolor TaxID=1415580 RepID=A0A6P7YWD1_9AMPH|nr:rho guanine nucleotide exchange factor 1 isoform X2 [Microcaecilia unicolor]